MADTIHLNRPDTCGWNTMKSTNFWGWAYSSNDFTDTKYNARVATYELWQASAQENKLTGTDEGGGTVDLSQSPPNIHPPTR